MIPRKELKVSEVPYDVDDQIYQRFPMRRQAFATVGWQDSGKFGDTFFLEKMMTNMVQKMTKNKEGYLQSDIALDLGANTLNLLLGNYGVANSQFLKWESLFAPKMITDNKVDLPPAKLTEMVKEAASLYGADLTGIATLDLRWVFSHDLEVKPFLITGSEQPLENDEAFIIPTAINKVIVMAVMMDEKLLSTSPAVPASTASSLGYSRMGITAVALAEYIRALGYTAIPCMNDTALSIPLAVDAGLGELGRHGLLITPEYGSNVRLCKVLTDMPLLDDKPVNFGIKEFCDNCLLCVHHCPPRAISADQPTMQGCCHNNNHGVLKWYINGEKCLRFWQSNGASCSNCIAVCPFTTGFLSEHCQQCERCDTTCGCSLQVNTYLRSKYGYLQVGKWGDKQKIQTPHRRGL